MTEPKNLQEKLEKKERAARMRDFNSKLAHFIDETDPNNPYGPNYYFLPRTTKAYYKYLRLSKFVHVDREDEEALLNFNYIFYSALVVAAGTGFLVSRGASRLLFSRLAPGLAEQLRSPAWLPVHSVLGAAFCTSCYFSLNDYYNNNYVEVLTRKYLSQAVQNGFVDYPISPDKK